MSGNLILKIKRRENRVYAIFYKIGEFVLSFNLLTIKFIHLPLYYFDLITKIAIKRVIQIFWSIPLFKARCERAGKNLRTPNGIPPIVSRDVKENCVYAAYPAKPISRNIDLQTRSEITSNLNENLWHLLVLGTYFFKQRLAEKEEK